MKSLIFLLVFVVYSSSIVGEEEVSYSLLIERAYKIRSSQPEEFISILSKLDKDKVSLRESDAQHLSYLKSYKEILYDGRYSQAINDLNFLAKQGYDNNLKMKAKSLLVNAYSLSRDFHLALTTAMSLVDELNSPDLSVEVKSNATIVLVLFFNSFKEYEHSLSFINKVRMLELSDRSECIISALEYDLKLELKIEENNDNEVDRISSFCDALNENFVSSYLPMKSAWLAYKDGSFEQVERVVNANKEKVKFTRNSLLITTLNFLQGVLFFKDGQYAEAENEFISALNKGGAIGSNEQVALSHKYLSATYEVQGRHEEAIKQIKLYIDKETERLNEERTKSIAYNLAAFKNAEKQKEIELLNQKNSVLKLEQSLAHKEASNNRLMLLLLLFILASLAFWAYRIKRNQIKLKKQSETDLLTGAASRHHFYFLSRKTLEYAAGTEQEVSFVLFDLDKFKSVNDSYGHLVGDWVLKKVIEVCRPCWRQNDIAGRLGGEEFALMLPTCDLDKAVQIAEKCRKAIQAIDTSDSGHDFNISASFGVTTSKVSGYSLQDLIGDADRVMYQAKAAGKNLVLKVASKS